jgi:hypothetical protein
MADEAVQYNIEFIYTDNGQIFQTGAVMTSNEMETLDKILQAYADQGAIEQQSVTHPHAVTQSFDAALNEVMSALKNEVSDSDEVSVCQDCEREWPDVMLAEVKDLTERVLPGEIMPSGECRACGTLCYTKKAKDEPVA